MASAWELGQVAWEREWRLRVEYWRLAASIDVMSEDPLTANHAERVTYAKSILAESNSNLLAYGLAVLTNDTIRGNLDFSAGAPEWGIPDADIEFTVNSLFNVFAGVATS